MCVYMQSLSLIKHINMKKRVHHCKMKCVSECLMRHQVPSLGLVPLLGQRARQRRRRSWRQYFAITAPRESFFLLQRCLSDSVLVSFCNPIQIRQYWTVRSRWKGRERGIPHEFKSITYTKHSGSEIVLLEGST